jgi:hypothetical protein
MITIAPLSLEDVVDICSVSTKRTCFSDVLQYPTSYNVTKGFLFSITSLTNGFITELDLLMNGLGKFGVLSPYPFYTKVVNNGYNPNLNLAKRPAFNPMESRRSSFLKPISPRKGTLNSLRDGPLFRGRPSMTNLIDSDRRRDSLGRDSKASSMMNKQNTKPATEETSIDKKTMLTKSPENFLRLDNTSALFAQHYSLIRELKMYAQEFKQLIESESDIKEVWKGFENLSTVLDTGCQFLSFPVQL